MSSNNESRGSCSNCVFFKVHDIFSYIGYCTIRGQLIVADETGCPQYKPVTREDLRRILEERGWLYCVTCRKTIHALEELDEYLSKNYLVAEPFSDEVAGEESPAAD